MVVHNSIFIINRHLVQHVWAVKPAMLRWVLLLKSTLSKVVMCIEWQTTKNTGVGVAIKFM